MWVKWPFRKEAALSSTAISSYTLDYSGVQSQRKKQTNKKPSRFNIWGNWICAHAVHNQRGQEEIQVDVVYEGSVVWVSSDRTRDRVRGDTGLTSRLNHLQTNPFPRQLNSLWLDLFVSRQWKVTGLWDFGPQSLMAVILPVQDLGIGRHDEKK